MSAQRMELLAPAGGVEQLKAAVRFGADAVYAGMKSYGLRAFAGNFGGDELARAVDYAHAHGKKFYVTMNIVAFDEDLDGFLDAARHALNVGVDAAIVSDLGAALMLSQELPALPLHISTQANVTNSRAALHYHEALGASRIILSREMSMEGIAHMRKQLPPSVELEAFVHGAVCVAHSGRCLLSAALTGRNGNRGACAQPCRWHYHVMEEKRPGQFLPVCEDERGTYLFSANDLCMLPHLPALRDAGICSLKIEGRMKTAYYVATVVSAYRHALDILQNDGAQAFENSIPSLMAELCKASHRVGDTGFYFGAPKQPAGADGPSQSMEYAGYVLSAAQAGEDARVLLKNRFFMGDALEALTPEGSFPFTVSDIRLAETGEALSTADMAGAELLMRFPFPVSEGDLLRGPNRNHRSV